MSLVRAALRSAEMQLKMQSVSPFAYLNIAIYPIILTGIGLALLTQGRPQNITYAILGGGLTGLWAATYMDAGNSINLERWTGTLEQIMASPTPLWIIVLGKAIASMITGIASFIFTIAVSVICLHHLELHVKPMPFVVSFLLTILAFFAVAMALAPAFPLVRWAFTVASSIEVLVYIACGFMFPIAQLPNWVQTISSWLPPTWAIRSLYAAAGQPGEQEFGDWWLKASLLVAVSFIVSLLFFRIVEDRARISGQLDLA